MVCVVLAEMKEGSERERDMMRRTFAHKQQHNNSHHSPQPSTPSGIHPSADVIQMYSFKRSTRVTFRLEFVEHFDGLTTLRCMKTGACLLACVLAKFCTCANVAESGLRER